LREHAEAADAESRYDEPLGTFFRNVDTRKSPPLSLPVGEGKGKIAALQARAVMIDMEESVVNTLLTGPLKDVFDPSQRVTAVSGSGNNWAVGHYRYGLEYREQISETIRRAAEECDCLQSFLVLHSMGGGTGSGLGTYVLGLLADEYPDVYRFVTAVFPSESDDVVTSPYNSMLALNQLTEHADCVLPVENAALVDICTKIAAGSAKGGRTFAKPGSALSETGAVKHPFDSMNNIVAHMLLHLTASSRFEGSLNVDINEISTNLVPFPTMHYLCSGLSPLYALADVSFPPRRLDQMFTDAVSPEYQLTKTDPRRGTYLACALMLRGNVEISDVRRNIARLQPTLKFVGWNQDGWKTGLCSRPPLGQPHALLALSNNTCVGKTFQAVADRYVKLYRQKAYVHHFTSEGMDADELPLAYESCAALVKRYRELEINTAAPAPRLKLV